MNSTQLLCIALGWQGGTIHQVSEETGLSTSEILGLFETKKESPLDESKGRVSLEHNRNVNVPRNKGNVDYWRGAASMVEMCLKNKINFYCGK